MKELSSEVDKVGVENRILDVRSGLLTLQAKVRGNLDKNLQTVVVFLGNYGTGKTFIAKIYADVINSGSGIVKPDEALIIPDESEGSGWGNFWQKLIKEQQLPLDAKRLSLFTILTLPFFWPDSFLEDPRFIYVGFQADKDTRTSNLAFRKESDLRRSSAANYSFEGKDYISFIIDTSRKNRITPEGIKKLLQQ